MYPKNILIPVKEISELKRNLNDEQMGVLLNMIIDYYTGSTIEEIENNSDLIAKISFSSLKPKIDYDIEKYRKQVEVNKQNGKKGGRPKKEEAIKVDKPKQTDKKKIYGQFKKVKLTDTEKNKLVEEYGDVLFNEFIKVLDEYKEMKGKTYKNDNLAIRKWVIDRVKEDMQKNNSRSVKNLDVDFSDF